MYTALMILRSLWPFLSEMLLKNRGWKDFFIENKLATFLSFCLAFLFILFMHVLNLADVAMDKQADLTTQLEFVNKYSIDYKKKNDDLTQQLADSKKAPVSSPAPVAQVPATSAPTSASSSPQAPRKPAKAFVEDNLRSYVQSKLNDIDKDGK